MIHRRVPQSRLLDELPLSMPSSSFDRSSEYDPSCDSSCTAHLLGDTLVLCVVHQVGDAEFTADDSNTGFCRCNPDGLEEQLDIR